MRPKSNLPKCAKFDNAPSKSTLHYYANCEKALKLYSIYKKEISNREPKLPATDVRRRVPQLHHPSYSFWRNINSHLSLDIIPVKKLLGWVASLSNQLINRTGFFVSK